MKPALAAYQKVLDRLGLAASRCVFIDDQAVNVHAAQTLGINGIVFHDNVSCRNQSERTVPAIHWLTIVYQYVLLP
jgi:FMN phosphatase YigB (HAD superfamily)